MNKSFHLNITFFFELLIFYDHCDFIFLVLFYLISTPGMCVCECVCVFVCVA